jgi:ribonuclease Z
VAELIVLGTAASVPDAKHDTIGLALRGPDWAVMIECSGSPLHKLARLGIDLESIRAVVLTHGHADHLYGLPMLAQGLWLGKRKTAVPIYGPERALDTGRRMLDMFDLVVGSERFLVEWHPVPMQEGQPVVTVGEVRITATPVVHGSKDTLALRFDNAITGRSIVYSSDTEPCPALLRLAAGVDLLIQEAAGEHAGHSSPAQAAETARQAGVARLALIHYPVYGADLEGWRRQAAEFPGPVTLAQDGDVYGL